MTRAILLIKQLDICPPWAGTSLQLTAKEVPACFKKLNRDWDDQALNTGLVFNRQFLGSKRSSTGPGLVKSGTGVSGKGFGVMSGTTEGAGSGVTTGVTLP